MARIGDAEGFRILAPLTVAWCLSAALATVPWVVPVPTELGGPGNGPIQVAANLTIFDRAIIALQGVAYGAKQAVVPTASLLGGLSLRVSDWRLGGVGHSSAQRRRPGAGRVPATVRNDRVEERAEAGRGRLPHSAGGFAGAFAGNGAALFVVPSAVDVGIGQATARGVLAVCFDDRGGC